VILPDSYPLWVIGIACILSPGRTEAIHDAPARLRICALLQSHMTSLCIDASDWALPLAHGCAGPGTVVIRSAETATGTLLPTGRRILIGHCRRIFSCSIRGCLRKAFALSSPAFSAGSLLFPHYSTETVACCRAAIRMGHCHYFRTSGRLIADDDTACNFKWPASINSCINRSNMKNVYSQLYVAENSATTQLLYECCLTKRKKWRSRCFAFPH